MAVIAPRASTDALVGFKLLERLGVDAKTVDQIRDEIYRSNNLLAADSYGRVPLGTLSAKAKTLGVPDPIVAQLSALMAIGGTPPIQIPSTDDWTKPATSVSDARALPAKPEVKIKLSDIQNGAAIGEYLADKKLDFDPRAADGVPVFKLRDTILAHYAGLTATKLTATQVESTLDAICSKTGPAYTERDALLDLKATTTPLALPGLPPGVGVHRKCSYDWLYLGRDGHELKLHGFRNDSLLLTLPPGMTAVLIDRDGDQHGVYSQASQQLVDGKKQNALEITRGMVQPRSRSTVDPSPSFTLKILDAQKNVVFDQALKFDKDPCVHSEILAKGTVGYHAQPEGPGITDRHLDHYVPNAQTNNAPVSERPEIRLAGGEPCDQLKIDLGSRTLSVNRLEEFLAVHGEFQGAGKVYKLRQRNNSEKALDDPKHDPAAGFELSDSSGHRISFDRNLSGMRQGRATNRGVIVETASSAAEEGRFDPFTSKR